MKTQGDEPRKIVVCHPDDFTKVNSAVMALGYGDVLVRIDTYVTAPGQVYVIDNIR